MIRDNELRARDDEAQGFREAPRSGSLFNIQAPTVFRLAHYSHKAQA